MTNEIPPYPELPLADMGPLNPEPIKPHERRASYPQMVVGGFRWRAQIRAGMSESWHVSDIDGKLNEKPLHPRYNEYSLSRIANSFLPDPGLVVVI